MKKILSLTLCLAMIVVLASSAFAIGFGDPAVVKDFVSMVNAIGDVTLEDKEAIEAAEDYLDTVVVASSGVTFYNRYIKEAEGGLDRGNANARAAYKTLLEAREKYDALVAGGSTTPSTPADTTPSTPAPSETTPSAPATEPSETTPSAPATEPSETQPEITRPNINPTLRPMPTETTPADTTPADTTPSTPSTPVDPNGDGTFMVIALAVLSMTALVVLVSKKRAF